MPTKNLSKKAIATRTLKPLEHVMPKHKLGAKKGDPMMKTMMTEGGYMKRK